MTSLLSSVAVTTALGRSFVRNVVRPTLIFLLRTTIMMTMDEMEAAEGSQPAMVTPDEIQAVCQSDYFRAKCSNDDVIMISHALYGRLRLSRCVKENFGYLGCKNDVLDIMDGYCSGRRDCSVRILDENFMNVKPCHDDLKSYLEVMHTCVKVVSPEREDCQHHRPIALTNLTGFLASVVSAETGCGTADSPWSISGLPGQRINITLYDFSLDSVRMADAVAIGGGGGGGVAEPGSSAAGVSRICVVYATIREASGRRSVTICGGEARRKVVHVSRDNWIEIRMISNQPEAVNFLLRYEIIGCPDLEAPPGGWVKNNEEVAVFGCSDGPETWQMVCRGVEWIGERANCSTVSAQVEMTTEIGTDHVLELPWGLSIIIIVALALSIWFIILAIGILCFKSQKTSEAAGLCRRTTRALNPAADALTVIGQPGPGSCAKHAVVCRLHNAQATSNLQRIKDSDGDRSTYGGPLAAAPFVDAAGCRDYGALKDPSPSSLMRRWSVVRGLIEDPSNPTSRGLTSFSSSSSYPCRSRYCLHSSRLQPQTFALSAAATIDDDGEPPAAPGMMYFPLCSQQQRRHDHPRVSLIHSPPQSTYSCDQSAAPGGGGGGKISGPPDVIASPEADKVYCSTAAAAEDQVAAWDWRTTTPAAAEESATNRHYFFGDAEKTAPSTNGNWMTSHDDVESTKMTLLKQTTTTTDNEIL